MRVLDRDEQGRPLVTPWHRWVSGYTTKAGRTVAPYLRVRRGCVPDARAWQDAQGKRYREAATRRELRQASGLRRFMEQRRMC